MTIGELVLNLSVKGTDKAVSGLKSIKDGLKSIASASFETKAAIIAAVYALERFTIGAAQLGTSLRQFNNETGLSTERLQRWQYAMLQSGVTAEETQQNVENVQRIMGKMALGQGAPAGWARVAQSVGLDFERAKIDTFYLMDKLREYAKKEKNITLANEALESFGQTGKFVGAERTNNLDLDQIPKSQLLSDNTINRLNRINIAWLNFWRTLKLFQGRLVANYGLDGIKELQNAFKFLTSVVSNIQKITRDFPQLVSVAKLAAVAIIAAFAPLTSIITGITLLLAEAQKYREGKSTIFSKGGLLDGLVRGDDKSIDALKQNLNKKAEGNPLRGVGTESLKGAFKWLYEKGGEAGSFIKDNVIGPPKVDPLKTDKKSGPLSLNVNVQNHGVAGAQDINQTIGSSVDYALRQMQLFQVS